MKTRVMLLVLLASLSCILSVHAQKVYRNNSTYTSDIVFNLRGDKVYRGNSTYISDVVCTIRAGRIYRGNSTYTSDILFRIDSPVTLTEFVAVYYCMNYMW